MSSSPLDPLHKLRSWIDEAASADLTLPSTMTLASVGRDGAPHSRTVLITKVTESSLLFHSSDPTTKTVDISHDARVSGTFHWPARGRQVIIQGTATMLPDTVSEQAFGSRPRHLQYVAWAYQDLLPDLGAHGELDRASIEDSFRRAASRTTLTRPHSWATIEVRPTQLDFWQGGDAHNAPRKIRYIHTSDRWRSFDVLP